MVLSVVMLSRQSRTGPEGNCPAESPAGDLAGAREAACAAAIQHIRFLSLLRSFLRAVDFTVEAASNFAVDCKWDRASSKTDFAALWVGVQVALRSVPPCPATSMIGPQDAWPIKEPCSTIPRAWCVPGNCGTLVCRILRAMLFFITRINFSYSKQPIAHNVTFVNLTNITVWYWKLCQRWKTICLLILALNMTSARMMWRLYRLYLQSHWSLCWCDIFCLSTLLCILSLFN